MWRTNPPLNRRAQEHRRAFYHALRDTLVAPDLTTAQSWAYGQRRWRVVTLKGELIDASGAMSGGGAPSTRALIGARKNVDASSASSSSAANNNNNELVDEKTLTAALAEAEKALAAHKSKCATLEAEIRTLEQTSAKLERQLPVRWRRAAVRSV